LLRVCAGIIMWLCFGVWDYGLVVCVIHVEIVCVGFMVGYCWVGCA
jgi:hypothetical protein